ncbi:MAG: glycine-rich domain-containing protein, partial [Kiritimatiellia bacterium]
MKSSIQCAHKRHQRFCKRLVQKSARALLAGAVLAAGLSAWAALPEQTVAVLEYRDAFDLKGTNFIVGTLRTLKDASFITNSTATSETVVLTVGDGDADSWLGGALYGPVVLRKVGAGALHLDETHFIGDVTIQLEGGTLSGNATAKDDLAVVQSNGANKAQIDVDGALAVSGAPAFAIPFLGCDTVFFSYASASSNTLALLESAPVAGASDGATITRNVTPEEFRYRAQVPLTGAFSATGGAKVRIGDDVVHTFGGSGTFTVTSGEGTMEVLIIAGGGGGAVGQGGAGGAGGVVYREALPVSARTEPYAIVVGAGGIGALCAEDSGTVVRSNTSGGNSSAFGLTAIGGGRGAPVGSNGAAGGSGGGNSRLYPNTHGGAGTEGQGFAGGNGTSYSGGGGGGAGAPGSQGHPSQGGIGRRFDIAGREVGYAGGGAGG